MKKLLFLTVWTCTAIAAFNATGLPLTPIAPASIAAPNVDPGAPDVPCDQILAALTNYQSMLAQNNSAMQAYLGQISAKLTEWYGDLKPLEGQAQPVPAGTFTVLKDGANKINALNGTASDNDSLLAQEFGRIQYSLGECQITAKRKPVRK